ncbi:MAG TPA: hypothetical protein VHA52_03065 [Candidatus Babeliaceae bacterium]|nr:hypothetical protein [Candidatus Babeliaceae bacterium]
MDLAIKPTSSPLKAKKLNTVSQTFADINEDPLKFPPTQFYIDQIAMLSKFLDNRPLYIHLFTDDKNPQKLLQLLQQHVDLPNITYGYNNSGSLIHDCYHMAQFDCLIKSTSTFSSIAQLIGDHMITIIPTESFWDSNILVINNTTWFIRSEKLPLFLG